MSDTLESVFASFAEGKLSRSDALAALKRIYGYAPLEGDQWLDDAKREYDEANGQFGVGA